MRFKDAGCAVLVSAEIGGGDPMLALLRKNMVHHIKKLKDLDSESILLADLPDARALQRLAELDAPAWEFPFLALVPRLFAAPGKKEVSLCVQNDGANANTDVIDASLHAVIITRETGGVQNEVAWTC